MKTFIIFILTIISYSSFAAEIETMKCAKSNGSETFELTLDHNTHLYSGKFEKLSHQFTRSYENLEQKRFGTLNFDPGMPYLNSFEIQNQTYPTGVAQGFFVHYSINHGRPYWNIRADNPSDFYKFEDIYFEGVECQVNTI
jgi:hypothetical protein